MVTISDQNYQQSIHTDIISNNMSTQPVQPTPFKQKAILPSDRIYPSQPDTGLQFDESIPRTQSAPPEVDILDAPQAASATPISVTQPSGQPAIPKPVAPINGISQAAYYPQKAVPLPPVPQVESLPKPKGFPTQMPAYNPYAAYNPAYYPQGYPYQPAPYYGYPHYGAYYPPVAPVPGVVPTLPTPAAPSRPITISAPKSKPIVIKNPATKENISLAPIELTKPKPAPSTIITMKPSSASPPSENISSTTLNSFKDESSSVFTATTEAIQQTSQSEDLDDLTASLQSVSLDAPCDTPARMVIESIVTAPGIPDIIIEDVSVENGSLVAKLAKLPYPENRTYSRSDLIEFSHYIYELPKGFLQVSLSEMIEAAPPSTSGRRATDRPASAGYAGRGPAGPPPGFLSRPGQRDREADRFSSRKPSRQGRGGRNSFYEDSPQAPLMLLPQTENRWIRPDHKNSSVTDIVLREIKGNLNKITTENFNFIVKNIIDSLESSLKCLTERFTRVKAALEADSSKTYEDVIENEEELEAMSIIQQIIDIFFEKAVDEPNFSPLYARTVAEISTADSLPKSYIQKVNNELLELSLFRKLLLSKCQIEYQKKVAWSKDRLERISAEAANTKSTDMTTSEAVDTEDKLAAKKKALDEEYARNKLKRHTLGNIAFIGHLFKNNLLNERIIHGCIQELLSDIINIDEEEIECCCKLFQTSGDVLEAQPGAKDMTGRYIARLEKIMKENPIPPRIKFLIMDLIELRSANWIKAGSQQPSSAPRVSASPAALSISSTTASRVPEAPRNTFGSGLSGRRLDRSDFGADREVRDLRFAKDDRERDRGTLKRSTTFDRDPRDFGRFGRYESRDTF
jgi:hypothetical protein